MPSKKESRFFSCHVFLTLFFGICATFWIPWKRLSRCVKTPAKGRCSTWLDFEIGGWKGGQKDWSTTTTSGAAVSTWLVVLWWFFVKKKAMGVTKIRWFSHVRCGKRERTCRETNVVMFFWNRLGRECVGFSLFESETILPTLNDESHSSKLSNKKSWSFRFVGPYHFSGRFLSW